MRIKVCGLSCQEDVDACVEAGVDIVGFIFVENSPRVVEPLAAARLDSRNAERFGVFADQPLEEVCEIMELARLDRVQLHGGESPDYAAALGSKRVVKTLWPAALRGEERIRRMSDYAGCVDCFLFDCGKSGGGHGQSLTLDLLDELKETSPRPFFIAGGLGVDNAAEIAARIKPFGVDMNSRLEIVPGRKDARKIKDAVNSLRGLK